MLQPEALYLSFIKVYSITDQSSNDNLMFFKVIYCCINFPLLSCGLRLSVSLGVYSKVKRLSCRSPLFPSGSSSDCRSGDESGVDSFHQGSVLICPRKFRLSFLLSDVWKTTLLYELFVCGSSIFTPPYYWFCYHLKTSSHSSIEINISFSTPFHLIFYICHATGWRF